MQVLRWAFTVLCLAAAAAAPALADAPFSFDTAYGRLPKNVKPIAYAIAVVPDVAAMRLAGTERILLAVRSQTATFATTPPMPSYLVEFTAGHIAAVQAKQNGTGFRVWAVRGQEAGGAAALANAEQILADYNDYFGVKFPLPTLNSLAIPGGFNGAMENWGAIVYDDQYLLVTPSSTLADRQTVYSIQAHEMAHQWNGDLVTMGWWDDLWLNESFASWRSAKETAERNPSWKWWEVEDGDKEAAMNADARATSHPIRVHITNELEAETAFDAEITYAKGQAFLRMLEAYIGPNVFRDGVRRYIKARAYANATAADLWAGLSQASHVDVGRLSSAWIDKPGFPLVSVRASCDAAGHRTIALAQGRFLFAGSDATHTRWAIPLSIRSGVTGPATGLLMTTADRTALAGRCSEPLTVNAGLVGFYRVAYDDATLKTNTGAFGTLPDADRIALLDDQWALARAGKAPLARFLALAGAMGDDRDARAWGQIADSLSAIEIDERGSSGHDAFVAYARSILAPLAVALGWDAQPNETPDVGNLRRSVLGYLGGWGDPAVIAEARKRFDAFLNDRSAIAVDDQQTTLTIVATNADAATFDQLHALAKASKNDAELRRTYTALMFVRDDALAKRALAIALSGEIPPQDADLQGNLVGALAYYHPALAWEAFTQNWQLLLKGSGTSAPLVLAQYVPAWYWNAAPPAVVEGFVKPRIGSSMLPMLARGMERMRFALDEQRRFVAAADAYLTSPSR